jgi:DNA-binding transcriptional ArsR family regulator
MKNDTYATWADLLKAVGHPIRIRIIESLIGDDRCVSSIWSFLGLPQSTVSQHLSLLRTKGIVRDQRCGSRVTYSISDKRVEELVSFIRKRELT